MRHNLVFLSIRPISLGNTIKAVLLFFTLLPIASFAQQSNIGGTVLDQKNVPISFVTVLIQERTTDKGSAAEFVSIKGTTTDDLGNFTIENLEHTNYTLHFSFIGFETQTKKITLTTNTFVGEIILFESSETLDEAVITVKRPTIQKGPGRLTFNVENTSVATGSTIDVLKRTPGVVVSERGLLVKNSTPVLYINNKRVYLSSEETLSLLGSMDAALIKSLDVITNPSSKYDADAGTVVNINTTRAVVVGYKGSVNGTYEQAVYAKQRIGTSHFYKNDWLNAYGSYSFSPRKEYKEDDNNTRFFLANEATTNGYRDSFFTRETKSNAHQGNAVLDITANENHSFGFSANVFISPNKSYQNKALSFNTNSQQQLDSTFTTASSSMRNTSNLAFNANHTWILNTAGAQLVTDANYVSYNADRYQDVATNYFSANGAPTRSNNFITVGSQESAIATGQIDLSIPAHSGALESGVKYSRVETNSDTDFLDTSGTETVIINSLSDIFEYKEHIFAAYIGYSKEWLKWSISLGLRGEQTGITGESKTQSGINTQDYFELFPKASLLYNANDDNSFGISYARAITRPKYESLNPFRYFINENNFTDGNPNLVPEIDSKYTVSYTYKNTWFLEAYYWHVKNPLEELRFQNNNTRALQSIDTNLIKEYQYSLDLVFANPVTSWWYLQVVTSGFFIENEFFALQSNQEVAVANTYGFYGQMYSGMVISEALGLSSDLTALYISNLIFGSYTYKNQFNLSASIRKKLWDNKASVTLAVDDIFNTNNIPVRSRYANQDNSYFARTESRLFRVGFTYNFGNTKLKDNNRTNTTDEGDRLK
ncbi:MAG: hypothetical protein ACI8RH_000683 [Flavobacteriales bacterium]|jgi:hypothetical protein